MKQEHAELQETFLIVHLYYIKYININIKK